MNPARFFAIQTCKVSKPIGTPGGGKPDLTPDIAAHYCQNMPRHQYQSALLRWADDWSGVSELEYLLWDEAVRLKNQERWRIEKKHQGREMLRKLAGLALWEMGQPSQFRAESAWQKRAEWMGVDKAAWFRTWRPRYEAVYNILQDWTAEGWRHVSKELAAEKMQEMA